MNKKKLLERYPTNCAETESKEMNCSTEDYLTWEGEGRLGPVPLALISPVLVLNGMTFEGQMGKLSDTFRVKLVPGDDFCCPLPGKSHCTPLLQQLVGVRVPGGALRYPLARTRKGTVVFS